MARMAYPNSASQADEDLEPLLSGYHCIFPRNFDEMMDHHGRVREHWRPFLGMLAALGPDDVNRRFAAADRHLRDSGVFYRVYEDPAGAERPWPLSHVPLLIDGAEWKRLKEGLVQRAELLEAVLADVYGPARLVQEGKLPSAVVAGNPEFLRPLVGAPPSGGAYLRFCAVDVGRGPDGQWWVLGDRTQAPSGAGFALENRVATTRALSDIYGEMHVHRLAGFFRRFRDALHAMVGLPPGRVAILTPGPLNETYYEHAYIARYLGIMLLEGEDLTVSDGRLMVRTVSGLMPISVLWRRMDAAFADPLELNPQSQIGTPGMAE